MQPFSLLITPSSKLALHPVLSLCIGLSRFECARPNKDDLWKKVELLIRTVYGVVTLVVHACCRHTRRQYKSVPCEIMMNVLVVA
jgi:hypothetical protein